MIQLTGKEGAIFVDPNEVVVIWEEHGKMEENGVQRPHTALLMRGGAEVVVAGHVGAKIVAGRTPRMEGMFIPSGNGIIEKDRANPPIENYEHRPTGRRRDR